MCSQCTLTDLTGTSDITKKVSKLPLMGGGGTKDNQPLGEEGTHVVTPTSSIENFNEPEDKIEANDPKDILNSLKIKK